MTRIDTIAYGNAWSARHPGEKAFLGCGLLLLSLALPPWPGAALVIVAAATAITLGARIPPGELFRVLALPLAFLLSGGAMLAVSIDMTGGLPTLDLPADGLKRAVLVSLRALAATTALMVIVLTTPLPAFVSLLRQIRLPEPLIDVAFLLYRFAGLAAVLATTGRRAQQNRLGDRTLATSVRSTGLLVGALLPRLLARAQRLQVGLAARGYDGALRTLPPERPLSAAFLAGTVAVVGAIATAGWIGGGLGSS
jgi:cobalt/nickel transport system permease protein